MFTKSTLSDFTAPVLYRGFAREGNICYQCWAAGRRLPLNTLAAFGVADKVAALIRACACIAAAAHAGVSRLMVCRGTATPSRCRDRAARELPMPQKQMMNLKLKAL